MIIFALLLCMPASLCASVMPSLEQLKINNPFSYDLGIRIIPASSENAEVTICCHGYGQSSKIADEVKSYNAIPDHLIGFNFPDYGIKAHDDHTNCSYGTINELLPLLFILKRCIIDLRITTINLYGFSAGGGAIINALALLNTSTHRDQLADIGIVPEDTKQILKILEKGLIILHCPLKSMEELIDFVGNNHERALVASRYKKNNMRPIDALNSLEGLSLNVLLHFQNPDEILGNRDDALYIARLKAANNGTTRVIIGSDGGHCACPITLLTYYKNNCQE